MRYCKRCVMPDTRPGIKFDSEGICQGCRTAEKKEKTDWNARLEELKILCNKYRGKYGNGFDCIIAVSGGKDSHYQVHVMKELMNMNPLLVTVEDNFPMTAAGMHNLKNISEEFGCNLISLKPNITLQKNLLRKTFEKYGKPTWYIDRLIYTYPIYMALKWKIPLVIYGENVSYEYGGGDAKESYSAMDQIKNGVASDIPWEELLDKDVTMKDLYLCEYPPQSEIDALKIDPIYLSYFCRWSAYDHYLFAIKRGFWTLTNEWQRTNMIEGFTQVDSRAYLVHAWMKYPKFGHATATDSASRYVRYGLITREEAIQLVKKHDSQLDELCVRDFCAFAGYTAKQFWDIVDRFYNREIFEKDQAGEWKLKRPVWEEFKK